MASGRAHVPNPKISGFCEPDELLKQCRSSAIRVLSINSSITLQTEVVTPEPVFLGRRGNGERGNTGNCHQQFCPTWQGIGQGTGWQIRTCAPG